MGACFSQERLPMARYWPIIADGKCYWWLHWQYLSATRACSCRCISNILRKNSGPICDHWPPEVFCSSKNEDWEHLSVKTVVPFKAIGSSSLETQKTHSCPSAVFFSSKNGPIQGYWQHLSGKIVGPSWPLAVFSAPRMGPHKCIGSISQEK